MPEMAPTVKNKVLRPGGWEVTQKSFDIPPSGRLFIKERWASWGGIPIIKIMSPDDFEIRNEAA